MKKYPATPFLIGLFSVTPGFAVDNQPVKPAWMSEGPYLDQPITAIELPIEIFANKILVQVKVAGVPKKFVFDTGSPSIISADLAAELNLKIIDNSQGKDSHGAVIQSQIAQTKLTLGDTTFHQVPVFVTDLSKSNSHCLWDGVLGSEILPLCAWQIDFPESVLRCNTHLKSLSQIKEAEKLDLYTYGYPHTPYLDIKFSEQARSKAMFDTGSSTYLAISPQDFEGARSNNVIGKTNSGYGSSGVSLGGQAPDKKRLQAVLKNLSMGPIQMSQVSTVLRESAPSLIGTSMLAHFIVTLDIRSNAAYFQRYSQGPYNQPSFGFSFGFNESMTIAQVWEHSPAAEAGLKTGQQITAINGQQANTSCEGIRHAISALSDGEQIHLEWPNGATTLANKKDLLN